MLILFVIIWYLIYVDLWYRNEYCMNVLYVCNLYDMSDLENEVIILLNK